MKTNSNNCRRSFFKKCMVLTAGATVIGSGTKLMAIPTDEWSMVAYCGLMCDDTCSWFKNNQCPGCKSANYACTVQKCARAKQLPTCAHCNNFNTCNDSFWTDNPQAFERIKELRAVLGTSNIDKQEVSNHDLQIFPNPAQDHLKIQNSQNCIFNYELVNINGQTVKKGAIENKELTIDISNLNPGNYLFKVIRNKNVLQTQKVIKL